MAAATLVSSNKSHGAQVQVYAHASETLKCPMKFAVIVPPQAASTKVPVLYFLSGLTCNEQNFITKAGAIKAAAEHGILIVCPDTSPRDVSIEGDSDSWDFGKGAGFYVDATESKWSEHYNMHSYVTRELPAIVAATFPADVSRSGIFGHSMGGHGALVCALRHPGTYKSVSAFAPICNPINCAWGKKAFTGYLGPDETSWKAYDATELVKGYTGPSLSVLIDQGADDKFLGEKQLLPEAFVAAAAGTPVELRIQPGYDHSYYFITTFVDEHIAHHARVLNA